MRAGTKVTPEIGEMGRFSVRVPKSLHIQLTKAAKAEGCSLNQLVAVALAWAIVHMEVSAETLKLEGE